jgi:hypothetical protein
MQRKLVAQPPKTGGISLQLYLQQQLSPLSEKLIQLGVKLVIPDEAHNCLHLSGVHPSCPKH